MYKAQNMCINIYILACSMHKICTKIYFKHTSNTNPQSQKNPFHLECPPSAPVKQGRIIDAVLSLNLAHKHYC